MKKILVVNLGFWAAAIAFPIVIRLLPTSTGQTRRFFEFLVPIFQIMLAGDTTDLFRTSIEKKRTESSWQIDRRRPRHNPQACAAAGFR